MDWVGMLTPALTALFVGLGGGGAGWVFARRQNKAETAKTVAEAALTAANADRIRMETNVEKVVSEKIGEVVKVLGEHTNVLGEHTKAIERVEGGLADVRHEVKTNTGTSLKDAVIRIEAESRAVNAALSASHSDRLALHEDLSGLKEEVRRYADAASREHERMWSAIEQMKKTS